MPEVEKYTPGTPCWVDVSTTDVAAASRFYSELFGWETEDLGEEAGHYTMCHLNKHDVAAIGPTQGGPPAWNTYFAVENADDAAARITAAGGTIAAQMDVFTAGRMVVAQDPTGGFFSVWQPLDHIGATLVNQSGTWGWNELNARGVDKALDFYKQVFGFGVESGDFGGMTYHQLQIDGRSVAGALEMPPGVPAGVPTFWLVYFVVDDTDAAVTKIGSLGGNTMMPAIDSPAGRFAVVSDPFGAAFGVITMPG